MQNDEILEINMGMFVNVPTTRVLSQEDWWYLYALTNFRSAPPSTVTVNVPTFIYL